MTDARSASPLREFAVDSVPLSVDTELDMARKVLAETDPENIHDHDAMIRSAVSLSMRLRTLTAAVEAGEGR
ncbi:hypothetical protein GFH48_19010 [Streptomyces fagopyri]|uniref:Uncharacterized protein n=1 Tax=Streptomyces fagopyri TaxID=2662397 RepID=A0A5Q0LEZ2_9ACTN|nr:hypothetical protein [Streptomyces fagopyri]QFZ75079.1 hypothetical protein GFH48_19010 [Streptomyces fagopyri]